MTSPMIISPSILSADFMHLADEVGMLERSGADWAHIDVMDGHFVPNMTMGVPMVRQLRDATDLVLDAHLMVSNPLTQIPWFLDAGADYVTFHIEGTGREEAESAISKIKDAGAKAGVALKPNTPILSIEPLLDSLDMVLVMSVEPGFSGQKYIEGSEDKVEEVARLAHARGLNPIIQVDGGIGADTVQRVVRAGASCVVCGNAVFGAPDPSEAISRIRRLAEEAGA